MFNIMYLSRIYWSGSQSNVSLVPCPLSLAPCPLSRFTAEWDLGDDLGEAEVDRLRRIERSPMVSFPDVMYMRHLAEAEVQVRRETSDGRQRPSWLYSCILLWVCVVRCCVLFVTNTNVLILVTRYGRFQAQTRQILGKEELRRRRPSYFGQKAAKKKKEKKKKKTGGGFFSGWGWGKKKKQQQQQQAEEDRKAEEGDGEEEEGEGGLLELTEEDRQRLYEAIEYDPGAAENKADGEGRRDLPAQYKVVDFQCALKGGSLLLWKVPGEEGQADGGEGGEGKEAKAEGRIRRVSVSNDRRVQVRIYRVPAMLCIRK